MKPKPILKNSKPAPPPAPRFPPLLLYYLLGVPASPLSAPPLAPCIPCSVIDKSERARARSRICHTSRPLSLALALWLRRVSGGFAAVALAKACVMMITA